MWDFMIWVKRTMWTLLLLAIGFVVALWAAGWWLEPTVVGPPVAPDPLEHEAPVVQVYGADVWGVRGRVAIHTWVATKAADEPTYEIAQVIGWRQRRGQSVVSITQGMPDRPWFRSPPLLLYERRGVEADALVERVREAVRSYPYADQYTMWPGPNSNSFTAWVALEVPELDLELPLKALGASWMRANFAAARADSIKGQ